VDGICCFSDMCVQKGNLGWLLEDNTCIVIGVVLVIVFFVLF
jgi:hypothetical protein